jgi:hypothetical protein
VVRGAPIFWLMEYGRGRVASCAVPQVRTLQVAIITLMEIAVRLARLQTLKLKLVGLFVDQRVRHPRLVLVSHRPQLVPPKDFSVATVSRHKPASVITLNVGLKQPGIIALTLLRDNVVHALEGKEELSVETPA